MGTVSTFQNQVNALRVRQEELGEENDELSRENAWLRQQTRPKNLPPWRAADAAQAPTTTPPPAYREGTDVD